MNAMLASHAKQEQSLLSARNTRTDGLWREILIEMILVTRTPLEFDFLVKKIVEQERSESHSCSLSTSTTPIMTYI